MPNTRQAKKRAARVRAIVLHRPRLRTCQAFFANTSESEHGGDKCRRIATARQSYTALEGGQELDTFRCGTHRIPLTAPDLLSTTSSLSGFAMELV